MNKCTMIMRNTFVLIAFALAVLSMHKLLGKTEAKANGPTKQFTKNLRRDRYLLLDSRIIDKTIGVKLTLGKVQKHPANPLFGQDRPWEHHYDNFYGNIIYDEELKQFRLWYLNFIDGVNSLLYACSDDGLNWVKPNLGKVKYNGNTNNNIVMMGRHGVSVFKDLIETDPAKRFKLFAKYEADKWYDQHIEVAFSADGINWSDFIPQKQISATADTDNNAFWAPTLNKYVAMTRQWSRCPYNDQTKAPLDGSPETDQAIDNRKGYRQVARTESPDFVNWTRAEVVLEGLNTRFRTHCLPVFYYAGVYLGMPGIWETMGERRIYTELAWSPGTVNWHRINPGTSFIPNSDVKGDHDYGMVWRCVSPLFLDSDEVWIYYGGFDLEHGGDGRKGYLCLATMKKDRWAGYAAVSAAGTIKTRLVKCAGKALHICADVKDGGSIRAEVVGVEGLSSGDSIPVTADVTDGVVTWPGKDLSALIGTQIKLRFELKNATLYSFSFIGRAAMKKSSTKKLKRVDLTKIPSPQVLPGNENNHYRDPTAIYHDGVFRLFFTVNQPRDNKKYMVSFLGTTTSRDLVNWTPVKLLTPEDPALNYSSPGNIIRYNGEWIMCFQTYPIPRLEGFGGDGTARLFIMRSKDLENWSEPELLEVKGPDVPRERMGRMIDPYLIEDKSEPGKWWCFYKQNGVSMSYSYDFKIWKYFGRTKAGENSCVLLRNDRYHLIHSPGRDGMGLMSSSDLKNWEPVVKGTIKLGYKVWPWAMARLTAGFALDLKEDPRVGKYLMFYHGTESDNPHEHIGICSLGIAWSDDLVNWSWPKKPEG